MVMKLGQTTTNEAPMLQVGASPAAVDAFSKLIENVFKAAFETRMDQETVRMALCQASETLAVSNVNISSNNFTRKEG